MKFLKVSGVVLLLFLAAAGGAVFRLKEVLFPENPLDLGQVMAVGSEDARPDRDEQRGPYVDPVHGTVNVLVVGLLELAAKNRQAAHTKAIIFPIFFLV